MRKRRIKKNDRTNKKKSESESKLRATINDQMHRNDKAGTRHQKEKPNNRKYLTKFLQIK